MPLYVYTCAECELELEELFAMGKAPDKIRCPLCGGYFTRDQALFAFARSSSSPMVDLNNALQATVGHHRSSHGPDCVCCRPRRKR